MKLSRIILRNHSEYITFNLDKPFEEQRTIIDKGDIFEEDKDNINVEVLQRFSTMGNYHSVHISFNDLNADLNKRIMLLNENGQRYNFNKDKLLLIISTLDNDEDYILCDFSNYKMRLCKNGYTNSNDIHYKYSINIVKY